MLRPGRRWYLAVLDLFRTCSSRAGGVMASATKALSHAEEDRLTAEANRWIAENTEDGDDQDPDVWPRPDEGRVRDAVHLDLDLLPADEDGGLAAAMDDGRSLDEFLTDPDPDPDSPVLGRSIRRGGHRVRLPVPEPPGSDVELCAHCGLAPAVRYAVQRKVCERCARYARRHQGKLPTKRLNYYQRARIT